MTVLWAIIILGALGLLFGILLAIAGKVFAVEVDPKEAAVLEACAGANCGACGYPGCSGTCGHRAQKFEYEGIDSCLAATRLGGGSGANVCTFGCMGFGDCVKACPFDAMHIVDGIAQVDREKCVGCMKCAEACPKKLIDKLPAASTDMVGCSSTDKGPVVMKYCDYGCIGCQKCKRECPADAITIENFLAVIDQSKCVHCGHCADICPRGCIRDAG